MTDENDKPTPLQERIHGEKDEIYEKDRVEDDEKVIKSGQAGNPKYKNMNNEAKDEEKSED